jgi:hypothetical protein
MSCSRPPGWIKYYAQGKPIRENTRTDSHEAARQILKEREGRVGRGEPVLRRVDRITYDEARDDLLTHYETTGERKLNSTRPSAGWRTSSAGASRGQSR